MAADLSSYLSSLFSSSVHSSSLSSTDTETEVFVNRRFRFDRRWFNSRVSGMFDWNISRDFGEASFTCFCTVMLLWLLAMMVISDRRPSLVWIGPNSSILMELNPLVVHSFKVKDLDGSKSGVQLWGLYNSPSLDVVRNWSESHSVSVPHRSYKGWPFYLNKGSSLNVSYSVKPEGHSVQLVVDEGMQYISNWLEDKPENQYRALSWNLVRGSGMIEVNISDSSDYYVALANSRMKDVMVELDIHVSSVLYDTKPSFYNCTFTNGECTFNTPMSLVGNSVVLTSPGPRQGTSVEGEEEEWYIRFSYEIRWATFAFGTFVVAFFTVLAIYFCQRLGARYLTENDSVRTPLLTRKDDDDSGDDFAADDADLEASMADDGNRSNPLCVICVDARRDCFFLPCGHSASCYQCGTMVAEVSGSCPICRAKLKKVKRIYTV